MNRIPFLFAVLLIAFCFSASSQSDGNHPDYSGEQWYLADPAKDKIPGINLDKAYQLLAERQGQKVIVAILDSGLDTAHADIRANLWKNPAEIPWNGIDDDGNGLVDDFHGWNYLGNPDGENITGETLEKTRLYRKLHPVYGEEPSEVPEEKMQEYEIYLMAKNSYLKDVNKSNNIIRQFDIYLNAYKTSHRILQDYFQRDDYTLEEVQAIKSNQIHIQGAKSLYIDMRMYEISEEIIEGWIRHEQSVLDTKLNLENDPRHIAGDDPNDILDTIYGNNNLHGGTPGHGTSVAGLVGAIRNNGFGINGIADNVEIMVVRIVPGGDERDKDVALGIRYAVNQGAKIINCSFGKEFSPEKWMVDEAVRYAEANGVLIVHAAGNSASCNDTQGNFPSPFYSDGTRASNWIEVGASTKHPKKRLVASFSNYGHNSVDLLAPGENVMTLKPGNGYGPSSGTSLAAPVVTGVAAIILSYFPELTPAEVIEILNSTVTPYGRKKVYIPGTTKKMRMRDLCRTGGVINAGNAVEMAEGKRQKAKVKSER